MSRVPSDFPLGDMLPSEVARELRLAIQSERVGGVAVRENLSLCSELSASTIADFEKRKARRIAAFSRALGWAESFEALAASERLATLATGARS